MHFASPQKEPHLGRLPRACSPGRALSALSLIVGVFCGLPSAFGQPASRFTLRPRIVLGAGYVENPFFDYLDAHTTQLETGTSATVHPALRARWHLSDSDRLELSGDLLYERYRADRSVQMLTSAARVGWQRGWGQRLLVELEGYGQRYSIDAFPTDKYWYGMGTLRSRYQGSDRWGLELEGEAGARIYPERVRFVDDPDAEQEDRIYRLGLATDFGPLRPSAHQTLWLGADLSTTALDSNAPDLVSRVDKADLWLDHDLHRLGWVAWAAAWRRSFESQRAGNGVDSRNPRLDIGSRAGLRLWVRMTENLRIAAVARGSKTWSNAEAGRYRQYSVGLELIAEGLLALGERTPPVEPEKEWASDWLLDGFDEAGAESPSLELELAPKQGPNGWRFAFADPGAKGVHLVGTFNGWSTTQLPLVGPDAQGRWTVVVDLPPGRHTYAFVVDGHRWCRPPEAPGYDDDEFGQIVGMIWVWPRAEMYP